MTLNEGATMTNQEQYELGIITFAELMGVNVIEPTGEEQPYSVCHQDTSNDW